MKILYLYSDKITISDIPWGLVELGEDVEIYEEAITLQSYVEEEKLRLTAYLQNGEYEAAITHNFSPTVSDACEVCGIKYISWVFDSPQVDLYTKAFYNSCNYIFIFDKAQCRKMQERKKEHIYYMPLAANVSKASALQITEEEEKKFSCDISFVGSLYEDNIWNRYADRIPAEIRRKMEEWMEERALKWEKKERLFGCLSFSEVGKLQQKFMLGDWLDIDSRYLSEVQFMTRKLGEIERCCILNSLAEKYPVRLYTGSDTSVLRNVMCFPPVNASEEAPKIYHLSKINLNMTLRSIETGVPQRVFDIMSVGGFVLSNYQEELEELFVPDKEIVLFHSMDELFKKVEYYREHEEERKSIAMNGYKKVRDVYSYPVALRKILDIAGD